MTRRMTSSGRRGHKASSQQTIENPTEASLLNTIRPHRTPHSGVTMSKQHSHHPPQHTTHNSKRHTHGHWNRDGGQ